MWQYRHKRWKKDQNVAHCDFFSQINERIIGFTTINSKNFMCPKINEERIIDFITMN